MNHRLRTFLACLLALLSLTALFPVTAGAEPMYPEAYYNLLRNEALPEFIQFKPNGPGCGCGGLGVLNMPQGTIEPSPQGKVLLSSRGGTGTIAFGEWTDFRVSSPDAALAMEVDGRAYAPTNYLSKGGMQLTLHIKPGDNITRLQVQIESIFPQVNPFTMEGPIRGQIYFPQTGQNIDPVFLNYWNENGGVEIFGYPLSKSGYQLIGGNIYVVQYFERARFEYHPENTATNRVLLGQFGRTIHGGADPAVPAYKDHTYRYFPQTGHNLSGRFLAYWEENGGLAIFGYPITEEFYEELTDGVPHTVQYFERARLEFHSENRDPYKVLLGQFGREILSGIARDRVEGSR